MVLCSEPTNREGVEKRMMSIADAMVKAGIVSQEETPNGKRLRRQKQESKAYREKIDKALEEAATEPSNDFRERTPTRDHRRFKSGEAIPEKRARAEEGDYSGPARVRGEMVWLHKTAPILVIEGKRGLTPEEMAAGRRR